MLSAYELNLVNQAKKRMRKKTCNFDISLNLCAFFFLILSLIFGALKFNRFLKPAISLDYFQYIDTYTLTYARMPYKFIRESTI